MVGDITLSNEEIIPKRMVVRMPVIVKMIAKSIKIRLLLIFNSWLRKNTCDTLQEKPGSPELTCPGIRWVIPVLYI